MWHTWVFGRARGDPRPWESSSTLLQPAHSPVCAAASPAPLSHLHQIPKAAQPRLIAGSTTSLGWLLLGGKLCHELQDPSRALQIVSWSLPPPAVLSFSRRLLEELMG